ncbi:hypothetical protein B0H10DRAFT_2243432 [Mycena sp. CBHHK59/15]|nr:hypothetical protein B0H10DRAFT_2243432 [Mycena sp. CBHHK59/15]
MDVDPPTNSQLPRDENRAPTSVHDKCIIPCRGCTERFTVVGDCAAISVWRRCRLLPPRPSTSSYSKRGPITRESTRSDVACLGPRELVGGKPETPPVHSARRRACKDELRKVGTTCVLAQSCAKGAQSLRAHSEEAVLRNADLWRHLQARPRPRAPALPAGFTLLDVLSVADDHPVEGPVAPHLPRKALGGGCAALSAATSHAPLTSLATCVLCPLKVQRRPLPTRRLALWWLKPASRAHRRWVSHPASSTRNTSRREHPRTDGPLASASAPHTRPAAPRLDGALCALALLHPSVAPPVRAANSARLQLRAPPTPRASFPPPGPDLNAHSRPEIISDLWAPWSANRAWRPQCAPPTPRASNSARRQLRAPPTPRASNSARLQLRAPPTPRASFPPPGPDLNAHSRPEIISDLWAPWSANRTPAESPRSCVRTAALLASAPGLPAEHRQVTPVLSAAALAWFRPRPSVSSGPSGSSLSLGSRLVRRHLFLPSARTLHRPRVPFVPPAITTAIRIIDATSPPRLGNIDSLENQCSDTGRTRPCDHLQSPRTHRISDHKPHSVKSPKAPKSPAGASADRSHECLHESGVRSYGQR